MDKQKDNDSNQKKKGSYMTRRTMLKTLGGLTAGALGSALLPSCEKHLPDNVKCRLKEGCGTDTTGTGNGGGPPVKSLDDVEHVVLLMQENRSFDHYFGTLSGVRGFDDPDVMKLDNGRSVFHQPYLQHPDGYLLPFHLNTKDTSAQALKSTSHSWHAQHSSWNNGKIDNWIPAHRKINSKTAPYVMGHYTRADIPFQYALADAFTICDAYHCSLLGPTLPNRMYWFTGTIDPEGKNGGPMITNHVPKEGFRWTTYAERLLDAGVSWKVYQPKRHHPGFNMLENFKVFKEADKNSQLYKRGVSYGSVNEFATDARLNRLPKVSWLVPYGNKSEHPAHLPAAGAAFVASQINAIASNPDLWAKTIFILNFDENDGLFDHVAPPVPDPGTKDEFVNGEPIGAGWRVPCTVISPWSAGGWVNSEPFDHTSVLQFLEKFTGVEAPNISQWRRDKFGDLTSTLRFDSDDESPNLPSDAETQQQLTRAKYEVKHYPYPEVPGSKQTMPTQEKGTRPHDS